MSCVGGGHIYTWRYYSQTVLIYNNPLLESLVLSTWCSVPFDCPLDKMGLSYDDQHMSHVISTCSPVLYSDLCIRTCGLLSVRAQDEVVVFSR